MEVILLVIIGILVLTVLALSKKIEDLESEVGERACAMAVLNREVANLEKRTDNTVCNISCDTICNVSDMKWEA